MFKVTFAFEDGSQVEVFANAGDNLLEVARGANVAIDAPCSGNASCGKCRVKLVSGEMDSKKTLHISEEEYEAGWRLACTSHITADVTVMVPDIAAAYKSRMKVADLSSPEEIAIFENAKRDVEMTGISLHNSLDIVEVVMDEPTSALDPELTGEVLDVMQKLAKEGTTMVVVTHEMGFARDVASRVVFMEDGLVVEEAPAHEFFENPKMERTKQFLTRYQ